MADRIRPSDFPLRPILDGQEELYTQTNGINEKFLVDQIVDRANSKNVTPLEFTFTNVKTFSASHNLGRQPVSIRVVRVLSGGIEKEIGVEVSSNTTDFFIEANSFISGKVYVL